MKKQSKTLLILIAAALAVLAIAPGANAATVGASCGYTTFSQPYMPWEDSADYVLTKNGTFEASSSGWTLKNGAKRLPGGNPHLNSGLYSIYLPVGSYALSPKTCIETGFPFARLFATTTMPDLYQTNTLRIDVVYVDAIYRKTVTEPAGLISQRNGWQPSPLLTLPNPENIKPDSNGKLWVQYKIIPLYRSAWKFDDFYVDPKRR
jgi:hypothetical protein